MRLESFVCDVGRAFKRIVQGFFSRENLKGLGPCMRRREFTNKVIQAFCGTFNLTVFHHPIVEPGRLLTSNRQALPCASAMF